MEMVGCRDRHGVDVGRREQLAEVDVGAHGGIEVFFRTFQDGRVGIADRDEANALDFGQTGKMGFASAVEADHGDAEVAIGAGDLGPRTGGESRRRADEGGVAEEGAAGEVIDEEGHDGEGGGRAVLQPARVCGNRPGAG